MFNKFYMIVTDILQEIIKTRKAIELLIDKIDNLNASRQVETSVDDNQSAIDSMYKTKQGLYSFKKARRGIREDV